MVMPSSRAEAVRKVCAAVLAQPDARWTSARLAKIGGATVVQLQRAFRDVVGLSPRDYVVACKRRRFLDTVRRGERVTDAIYEAGFGSPSRVYDAIRLPGMTPATYGRGGCGSDIHTRCFRFELRIVTGVTLALSGWPRQSAI